MLTNPPFTTGCGADGTSFNSSKLGVLATSRFSTGFRDIVPGFFGDGAFLGAVLPAEEVFEGASAGFSVLGGACFGGGFAGAGAGFGAVITAVLAKSLIYNEQELIILHNSWLYNNKKL